MGLDSPWSCGASSAENNSVDSPLLFCVRRMYKPLRYAVGVAAGVIQAHTKRRTHIKREPDAHAKPLQ